jgi:hypothetical protein
MRLYARGYTATVSEEKAYLRWKEERLGQVTVLSTLLLLLWMPPASTPIGLAPTHANTSAAACWT